MSFDFNKSEIHLNSAANKCFFRPEILYFSSINKTLFTEFFGDDFVDDYATTKEHGTGLGLSIVRQTIADHNGYTRFQNLDS